MNSSNHPDSTEERSNLIHREILQLVLLIGVAVVAFFVTRAIGANNRDMSLRDGAEWFRRGQQQIEAGRVDDAIDAFRRATVRDRAETRYVLALAGALALNHDDEAARSALLTLRESSPEDASINLELARLAAHRQDVTEALRFYHNALYAPWPAERAEARRRVRFELIRFLLTHAQSGRALSELLAVNTDLPDEAPAHLEVAQLFADAGDDGHALEQFQRALRLAPDSGTALAGAGQSAFHLGDYALAQGYLRRAPRELGDVESTREIADLVLSNDPLANRIGSVERRRRLVAAFSSAQQRFTECLGQRATGQITDDEMALRGEVNAFQDRLKPAAVLEQDAIEAGVDLMDRIAETAARTCGPPTALDQALLLIGRTHEAGAK